MSAVGRPARRSPAPRRRTGAVVRALALAESRRMLRNPVLWAGAGLSVWMMWSVVPDPDEWPGASYEEMAICAVPLLFAALGRGGRLLPPRAARGRRRGTGAGGAAVRRPVGGDRCRSCCSPSRTPRCSRGASATSAASGSGWSRDARRRRSSPPASSPSPSSWRCSPWRPGPPWGVGSPSSSAVPLLFVLWFLVSVYWLFGDAGGHAPLDPPGPAGAPVRGHPLGRPARLPVPLAARGARRVQRAVVPRLRLRRPLLVARGLAPRPVRAVGRRRRPARPGPPVARRGGVASSPWSGWSRSTWCSREPAHPPPGGSSLPLLAVARRLRPGGVGRRRRAHRRRRRSRPHPPRAADATPVVIDSDLAPDDLAAIAYLVRHPAVDVLAISVPTTGMVTCGGGVDLLADFFEAIGAARVPVACGATERGPARRAVPARPGRRAR